MGSLRSQKQIVSWAIGIFAISTAHATPCVQDYLTKVLPALEEQYQETKRSLQIGSVHANRYPSPKNMSNLAPGLRSVEAGEITRSHLSKDHWLSKWVDQVHAQGGQLRLLEHEVLREKSHMAGQWEKVDEYGAYFFYDQEAKVPYIALSVEATPDTLAHEFDHMEKWVTLRNYLMEIHHLNLQTASLQATKFFFRDVNVRQQAERAAVSKELQKDSEIQRSALRSNPVKWLYPSGALPFTKLDALTSKLAYPEIEAVQLALEQKRMREATEWMHALIRKALLLRLTAYQRAHDAMVAQMHSKTELKLNVIQHIRDMRELENLDQFFDSIMVFNKHRFEASQVYDQAKNLFEAEFLSVWESLPAQKRGKFQPRFKAK